MESKSDLVVFNRKEIAAVIILFVLVALFSFTLGLRLGKTLSVAKAAPEDHAPLVEKKTVDHAADVAAEDHSAGEPSDLAVGDKIAPRKIEQQVEDKADAEFAAEAAHAKVGLEKPVPMALPKVKKAEGKDGHYTLQVGSHRTVAEATEQVTALKRADLEAFYVEAKVPGKGTWYRVGVGMFDSKDVAEIAAEKWKATKPLPPFIVQKITE